MMNHTKTIEKPSVKLFVAGIPSGVKPQTVLEFFSAYGYFELCQSCSRGNDSGRKKGYCNLLGFDANEINRVVGQRFFKFMNRTLTVTRHKSGVDLIIYSKRINKCRVIFKKVPVTYSEITFSQTIRSLCGEIESLFQFQPALPLPLNTGRKKSNDKKLIFSVVFKNRDIAQNLIRQGTFTLAEGIVVKTEPYLKGKLESTNEDPRSIMSDRLHATSIQQRKSKLFKKSSLETRESKPINSQDQVLKKSAATFSYQIKPCSKAYEADRRIKVLRSKDTNYNSNTNYKFNAQSSEGKYRRAYFSTGYGAVLIK